MKTKVEFLVVNPGLSSGSRYSALAGACNITDLSVGEGKVYDSNIDRLVSVKFRGEVLGVSRRGNIRLGLVRGEILVREEPESKWGSPSDRDVVLEALATPPSPGDEDGFAGAILGASAMMEQGISLDFMGKSQSPVDPDRTAYKAAQAEVAAVYRQTVLDVVRKHAPDGSVVTTYDDFFKIRGSWGRKEIPDDPNFRSSEELGLDLWFEYTVFVKLPEGSYQLSVRKSGEHMAPGYILPSRSAGSGILTGAPEWMASAYEELKELPLPAWPSPPDGRPD